MTDFLPLIVIIAVLLTALVVMWNRIVDLTTHLRETIRRAERAEAHLHETQAALQTALGGGWQLADHTKDVFLLPEAAILDFSDTLTGGKREQYRRSSTVRVFTDQDLYQRVINADRLGIPISFRGLEWRLTELGQIGPSGCHGEFTYVGGPQSECILELVTYAARKVN